MKNFSFLKYVLLIIPSTLFIMVLWSVFVDGNLYYCSDKVPLLDFIPPFVHGSHFGDYYIAPVPVIWTVWIGCIVAIFTLPFIFINLLYSRK